MAPTSPTLGLLATKLEPVYQGRVWQGVAEVARERGANLITFVGGLLGGTPTLPYDHHGNLVYELAGPETLDGLIIIATSIATFGTVAEVEEFCRRYTPLPVVTVGLTVEGLPSVTSDNAPGLQQALTHLIEDHGCRRIAFIRGPENHPEAEVRYRIYRESLARYGLPLDPELVVPGDFAASSSVAVPFLESGCELPDAIIAANDVMALDALAALTAHGLHVPRDVAVVGYDDMLDGRLSKPPLTTVHQSVRELGTEAARLCLEWIARGRRPASVVMPTTLVRRRSCGCPLDAVVDAGTPPSPVDESGESDRPGPDSALTSAFHTALDTGDPLAFLSPLEHHIEDAALTGEEVFAWNALISTLRRRLRPSLAQDAARLERAEALWGQARVIIGSAALQAQDTARRRQRDVARSLRAIGEALTTSFDVGELVGALVERLPGLGIPGCQISLYEMPDADTTPEQPVPCPARPRLPDRARVILDYDAGGGRRELPEGTYPTHWLLPLNLLTRSGRYHKIVEPLYFQDLHLGFAVFEAGPAESVVYDSLRDQLSAALKGALLLREVTRAYSAVEKQIARRTAQLEAEIAERRRIELARAALYRISEAAHSAQDLDHLYPAIHDIVGEMMPAGNFYIAIYDSQTDLVHFPYFVDEQDPPPPPMHPGKGLTELVIRTGQALLVDPPAFDALVESGEIELIGAPSLDWIGVPLATQGEVIGALVIQTYDPAIRYTHEDCDMLLFVSAQIGTAIRRVAAEAERARLLAALQHRNTQLQTASEISKSAITFLDSDALIEQTVAVIKESFGFDYAGIYLVDEAGAFAHLRANAGDVTSRELDACLAIDDASPVGWCIGHAMACLRPHSDDQETATYGEPDAHTPAEVVLPLMAQGGTCLGALIVRRRTAAPSPDDDVAVLQTMADHLAVAIENARLHEEVRRYTTELEMRVSERTAELVTANQELASFSYSVSHDLRAPLRSIDGFSQALLEDYGTELDAVGQDYLRRVRNATQQMGQLIDDLLKLSRLTRGDLHRMQVDMTALAAEVAAVLEEREPARVVRVRIETGVTANGDPRLLRVALDNLLNNAWKFTSHTTEAEITFGTTQVGDQPAYYVRDNGVGFDMAYADKLFGAFQRLHAASEFEGNGIGLATVQRIIHRHGGRIWAEAAVGEGATFYFTLPAAR